MRVLIRKVHCVDPRQGLDAVCDVAVEDGRIQAVEKEISAKGDQVIQGEGLHLFPGFLDAHVHLRDPGQEHKETIETGIRAALNGGIVGMISMPNTRPACDSRSVVEYVLNKAEHFGYNLFPCGAQSKERKGKELAEMAEMKRAGVCGFSDDGDCVMDSLLMRHVMEYAAMLDLPLLIHAEDKNLSNRGVMHEGLESTKLGLRGIPAISESLIVMRDIELSKLTGARIHICHISAAETVRAVRAAKRDRVPISCEVSPHHFALTDVALRSYDCNFKMYPPLRCELDRQAILEGLRDGTIDMIATDHAPHLPVEKDVDFDQAPFGCIGLETAIGVTLTELFQKEKVPLTRIVELWNYRPAELVKQPDFGAIRVGNVANLTLVDLDQEWVVNPAKFQSKSRNTTFAGVQLKGKPVKSICRGVIFDTDL